MKPLQLLLMIMALFYVVSLMITPSYAFSTYKILSIDSLKNGVFLIYVKDSLGQYYKTISVEDTNLVDSNKYFPIHKGLLAPLQLSSLYREHIKTLDDYDFVGANEFFHGTCIRGNIIPTDMSSGTLGDVYKIENSNGLFFDSIPDTSSYQYSLILPIGTADKNDSIVQLVSSIKQNMTKLVKNTNSKRYVIYSYVEHRERDTVIQIDYTITQDTVTKYEFYGDSVLLIMKSKVTKQTSLNIFKVLDKLRYLDINELGLLNYDFRKPGNYENKKEYFGRYPTNPIVAYYENSSEVFNVLFSKYRRTSKNPKKDKLMRLVYDIEFIISTYDVL